ncbi:hypothetical protein [Nonomuraea diastatica]|uniref:Uncharacterized protein n=1 Tax=Nonomuraea diastatica TaxID=1848329 RepID=A0A4R4WUK8_9ACTN|nr:hypothetical protein [Nonomuraea diastatica]TDD21340.1 hypothetical protein E1294_15280 [Nonomuraea diastatica]
MDAFRLVSGVSESLIEKSHGTENNGDCRAFDKSRSLSVWWAREGSGMPLGHMEFLMDNDRQTLYRDHGGISLPPELGEGMAAYVSSAPFIDQPYRVSAMFRCGDKQRMIDIYLPQIAKGRDGIKDLIELMRIAQQRYSKVYDCELDA